MKKNLIVPGLLLIACLALAAWDVPGRVEAFHLLEGASGGEGDSQLYTDALFVYDFDGDATDAKGNYDLTASATAPTFTTTGAPSGQWAVFVAASTQYFTHADNDIFDIGASQDYSVSFWMKVDTGGDYIYPYGKHDASNDLGYSATYVYSGDTMMQLKHATSPLYPAINLFTPGTTDTFHVVIIYDYDAANEVTLYVSTLGGYFGDTNNGTTFNLDVDPASNTQPFYIGSDRNVAGNYHSGKIDEFVMWKRVINATEAQALYDRNWR